MVEFILEQHTLKALTLYIPCAHIAHGYTTNSRRCIIKVAQMVSVRIYRYIFDQFKITSRAVSSIKCAPSSSLYILPPYNQHVCVYKENIYMICAYSVLVGCLLHYNEKRFIEVQGNFVIMLRTATYLALPLYHYNTATKNCNTTYHHHSALFLVK